MHAGSKNILLCYLYLFILWCFIYLFYYVWCGVLCFVLFFFFLSSTTTTTTLCLSRSSASRLANIHTMMVGVTFVLAPCTTSSSSSLFQNHHVLLCFSQTNHFFRVYGRTGVTKWARQHPKSSKAFGKKTLTSARGNEATSRNRLRVTAEG